MKKYEMLKRQKNETLNNMKQDIVNLETISDESLRVSKVARDAPTIISNLDNEFSQVTKLDKMDISFLFFAVSLQCVRQYLLTSFKERLTDAEAAKRAKGEHVKETSDRLHAWYRPSLDEIISSPVPYDAIFGSKEFDIGLGGKNHRFKTLGHDPLLGWIFGTANTLTSTLTTWDFQSYHVKTGYTSRGDARDRISNKASTNKVFDYTYSYLLNEGTEGKTKVGASLIKQGIHLKSDEYSKMGLPLPIISTISPNFAQSLAEYGLDIGNLKTVGKQASISVLINILIAMTHGMFYDKNKYQSWRLYEVKTRKILSYSNVIAYSSNIIYLALSRDLKKLDIGGILVTLYRIIKDANFIKQVKQEFLADELYKLVSGSAYDF